MHRFTPPPRASRRPARSRRGAALVIVLSALVLVSLLVVAFFSSVSRELQASKSYATGASAKIYADAAVNLVISQLRAGTGLDDSTVTWVSQPGLIRQFDDSGRQNAVYKLYSSNEMVAPGTFSPASGGDPADTPTWSSADAEADLPWNAEPGVYTDLNRPAVVDGQVRYPILNPGGLDAATRVEGFDVDPTYAIADRDDWDEDGNTSEIAQIPMPVRWLYILADGSFASATAAGDRAVTLTTSGGGTPATSNPPVARVAFWTDDDTSRLNINTASEGDFWAVQIGAGADDSLATNQVNSREYQRYPGHPATTSLSPVLDFLTDNDRDLRNFIYALSPRISGRGSQFGTRYIGYGMPVNVDNDRLYASVDELLFLPSWDSGTGQRFAMNTANIEALKLDQLDWIYSSTTVPKSMAGGPYSFATPFELDPDRLEIVRFFLTANSRAPEVNLFGRPRISLWPIDTRSTHRSIHDDLLAFTSTANGGKYFFQRQDPNSQTADYTDILRNQQLLAYLADMEGRDIPGFGGTLASKYGNDDRDHLRANIFDWVRTVNLAYRDEAGIVESYAWENNDAASGTEIPPGLPGSGQVLPIKIAGKQGVGRFPVLSKGALSIIRESETANSETGTTTLTYRVALLLETYVPMLGYAAYIPDYRISVSGFTNGDEGAPVPSLRLVTRSHTSASEGVSDIPISFQSGQIRVTAPSYFEIFSGRSWGGTQGFDNLFVYSDTGASGRLKPRTIGSSDLNTGYPFVSDPIEVTCKTADAALLRVGLKTEDDPEPAVIQVTISDAAGSPVTTYALPFASFAPVQGATLAADGIRTLQERVNKMVDEHSFADNEFSDGHSKNQIRFTTTVINQRNTKPLPTNYSGDVVRGVELEHGDLRLLAAEGTNGANQFTNHKDYKSTSLPLAHSLLRSAGSAEALQYGVGGASSFSPKRGLLVAGTGTSTGLFAGTSLAYLPQVPSTISDIRATHAPGDFSTGIASESDGPHIMKADEGNSSYVGWGWGLSHASPYQNQLFPWDTRLSDAFSPNRQVTSAVQLGSLPAMAGTNEPWRTLLFRPNFEGNHPGAAGTPDYLLLDRFWMPVVDPYPISEPLSTAGKINMNYQIAPFTYIDRSTGMLGALKSARVLAVPPELAGMYKSAAYVPNPSKGNYKYQFLYGVDGVQTMRFFQERFSKSSPDENVFKSAAEICSIPLAPHHTEGSWVNTGHTDTPPGNGVADVDIDIAGATNADDLRERIDEFWSENTLTGDNVQEAPYNTLYPRLTTQSNSYTVYLRVQTLQVRPGAAAGTFSDKQDVITGEYRGSQNVLRYIDPADTAIPDFASASASGTLYPYYKFEVKGSKQFIP